MKIFIHLYSEMVWYGFCVQIPMWKLLVILKFCIKIRIILSTSKTNDTDIRKVGFMGLGTRMRSKSHATRKCIPYDSKVALLESLYFCTDVTDTNYLNL